MASLYNDSNKPTPNTPDMLNERALAGMYEISKLLLTGENTKSTLTGVLTVLAEYHAFRHALIALMDRHGEPTIVVGAGWAEVAEEHLNIHLSQPVYKQIMTTGMPIVIQNVVDSPLFMPRDLLAMGASLDHPLSFIGTPIKDTGHVMGSLTVDWDIDLGATRQSRLDMRYFVTVANLVAQAMRFRGFGFEDNPMRAPTLQGAPASAAVTRNEPKEPIPGILGESDAIRAVEEKVRVVATTRSTVMLRGETGVGKEAFAAAVHRLSPRKDKPFIKLNCAALSESVLESELFGHERGAFTGALAQHRGRFELADGGTLFLDEIGEIGGAFQSKLLRVLQEGEFERVGGNRTIKVDVRLVCATNRDLESDVKDLKFRADLYYRLSVVPILIPPLRERRADIKILAAEFLRRFNREQGTQYFFTPEALAHLAQFEFPGNIRELENCVCRTATLATKNAIDVADVSSLAAAIEFLKMGAAPRSSGSFLPTIISDRPRSPPAGCSGAGSCAAVDFDHGLDRGKLINALGQAGWVQAKAARLLKLTPPPPPNQLRDQKAQDRHSKVLRTDDR